MRKAAMRWLAVAALAGQLTVAGATPANKASLKQRYGDFLAARLDSCATCHLADRPGSSSVSLATFPHNPFGARLRAVADSLRKAGQRTDLGRRLAAIAREDSDGDGVDNETELLTGHRPGDAADVPTPVELAHAAKTRAAFGAFLKEYRWQPFEIVAPPPVPSVTDFALANPIDRFLEAARRARGLHARPEAPRVVLLRRVTFDLTGLLPTPEETAAFLADRSPDAYERTVDRLLASPRYGERWGRHFMDVWRYSDWAGWVDGGQIRDSQPHIWRWRDWIVDSLNADKGYDRMVQEMLAADELAPSDPDALRATGFLVRNFKLLSREQWLEDTVNHTSKAFLGITMHCAKCHAHMYDPISQDDYYRFRAIFEPHQVRIDRVPGEADTSRDGLALAYDADPKALTYFYPRGDERHPDKERPLSPGVPESLGGHLDVRPVALPASLIAPDRRAFVVRETTAASEAALLAAWQAQAASKSERTDAAVAVAEARHRALLAVLAVEALEETGQNGSSAWKAAAELAVAAQRAAAVAEARQALLLADDKKRPEARAALDAAEAKARSGLSTAYTPRIKAYPAVSTGRRLALARWLTARQNPLTARVAVNHLWLRHFGQALVPSVADFGRNGQKPLHPQLLDYLADRLMTGGWKMKALHRLMVTSQAYRMDSRSDPASSRHDPDNLFYTRASSRRMEAEAVRDNVLYVAGHLDETRGGPEIDHLQGLTSRRRSLYLRQAAERQAEFLQIFDGPSVTECYARKPTVLPQQALALANSELALREARSLARTIVTEMPHPESAPDFVAIAFRRVLSRPPTPAEARLSLRFLAERQKPETTLRRRYENLTLVLFNHNDFITIR